MEAYNKSQEENLKMMLIAYTSYIKDNFANNIELSPEEILSGWINRKGKSFITPSFPPKRKFILPGDEGSPIKKAKQNISRDDYDNLEENVKILICNFKTTKGICGAFPVVKDNLCNACSKKSKPKDKEEPEYNGKVCEDSVADGITFDKNPGKLTIEINKKLLGVNKIIPVETTEKDIFTLTTYKLNNILLKNNSGKLEVLGRIEDLKCTSNTGIKTIDPNWKEKLVDVTQEQEKILKEIGLHKNTITIDDL